MHVTASLFGKHVVHKILVARDAGALRDPFVAGFDLDRILVATEREGERMEESVVGFGDPFADRVMRQMAVVADRHVVVAAFLPRVHVVLHDVAIDARLRVIAEVAGAFAVSKGERAHSGQNAEQRCEDDRPGAEARRPAWRGSRRRFSFGNRILIRSWRRHSCVLQNERC